MLEALAATVPQQLIIASHRLNRCWNWDIASLLYPFAYRKTPIQLVSLRRLDFEALSYTSGMVGQCAEDFSIRELELVDLRRRWEESPGNWAVGREKVVRTDWETVPWLCERADTVRVRQGAQETLIHHKPDDASTDPSA
jgi:hypothetical protein